MITPITALVTLLLYQLKQLLEDLTDEQYSQRIALLSNASIGEHTRHIIEFFAELESGYENGCVNYDARKRDHKIETQRKQAISKLLWIVARAGKQNKPLLLESDFGIDNSNTCKVPSNYGRELLYNLEHTIHHMALLRIAVNEVSAISLPVDFGVAVSTIKYRQSCAQ